MGVKASDDLREVHLRIRCQDLGHFEGVCLLSASLVSVGELRGSEGSAIGGIERILFTAM